jgi:arginyl-tRNA synthetase
VAALVQYFPYYLLKSVPLDFREEVWRRLGFPTAEASWKMEFSPNLLVDYLIELAHTYHRFYQNNRIVGSDREGERLTLTKAVLYAVRRGLNLLGVSAPERMG